MKKRISISGYVFGKLMNWIGFHRWNWVIEKCWWELSVFPSYIFTNRIGWGYKSISNFLIGRYIISSSISWWHENGEYTWCSSRNPLRAYCRHSECVIVCLHIYPALAYTYQSVCRQVQKEHFKQLLIDFMCLHELGAGS